MLRCFTDKFTEIVANRKEGVAQTCGAIVQEGKTAIEIGTIVNNVMCVPFMGGKCNYIV